MEVRIKNFRGIDNAEIRVDGVTLVAGLNGSGKSSIVTAVAATVAGVTRLDEFGIKLKKDSGELVRDGANRATVKISDDAGYIAASWPDCETAIEGTATYANVYVSGAVSLMSLDAKARAATLIEMLGGEPAKPDIAKALADAGLKKVETVETVWGLISKHGWDAAHSKVQRRGVELKAIWENITGVKYGSKKAEDWEPDGLPHGEGISEEDLQARLAKAQEELERSIGKQAISNERREDLQAQVDALPSLRKQAADIETAIDGLQTEIAEQTAKLSDVPAEVGGTWGLTLACPHCEKTVIFFTPKKNAQPRLVKPNAVIPDDELKKHQLTIASVEGATGRIEKEVSAKQRELQLLRNSIERAESAKETLDEAKGRKGGDADVAAARASVDKISARLAALRQYKAATLKARAIEVNTAILGLLAPGGGVRLAKLQRCLDDLNEELGELSSQAKVSTVSLRADMDVYYGSRRYSLLSRSERMRATIILQVALARRTAAKVICVDDFETLQPQSRPAVLKMLKASGVNVIVAMMAKSREAVPAIEKAKLGRAYWVENGEAERMSQ